MLRVAILSADFPPVPWGIASLMRDVARACSDEASVTVLAPRMRGAERFDRHEPYRVIRVANPAGFSEASLVQSLLRLEGLDLLICATWPLGLSGLLVSCLRGVPYVVWVHGSDIVDDWRSPRRIVKSCLRPLKRLILDRAAGIVANSRYTRGLVEAQGVPSSAIHVIVPPVNTDRFVPGISSASMCRLRRGAQHCLLTVARLDPHKGHRLVLTALAHHLRDLPGLRYLIAGAGPEAPALRRLVDGLGLSKIVDFLGFVPDGDLPDLYRAADLVVMPSAFLPGRWDLIEGFGIAYAEASASGKPVIAGRSGGAEDAVQDGVTGRLVDPDDAVELAEVMRTLLLDRPLAERMGRAGRDWACEHLSFRRLRERLLTLV